jgi:hypothetical protein
MGRLPMLLTGVTLLAGCATGPQETFYSGPGNQTEFMQAHYQCIREIQNTTVSSGNGYGYSTASAPACAAILSCLAAKGYTPNPNGSVKITTDTRVPCV